MSKKIFILPGLNGDTLFLEAFKKSLYKAALLHENNDTLGNSTQAIRLEHIHMGSKRIIPIEGIENNVEDVIIKEVPSDINFILVNEDTSSTIKNATNINISTPFIKSQWDIEIIEYPKNQILTYPELQEYVFQQIMNEDEFYILAESFSGPIAASLVPLCHNNIKGIIFAASFIETPLLFSHLNHKLFNTLPYMSKLHKMPFGVVKKLLLNNYHDEDVEEKIKQFLATAKEEIIYSRIKEVLNLNNHFLNTYNDSFVQFNGKVLSIVAGQDNLLLRFANLPFMPMVLMNHKLVERTHFSSRIADRIPQTQTMFFHNAPHMILELYPDKMATEIMNWIYQH